MAYNFPDNPSNGDTFTLNGVTYAYNSTKGVWKDTAVGTPPAPSVTSSDTAPANPSSGDLWYRTDDSTLYVYYNDGSSSQWVGVSGPAGPAGAAGADGATGPAGAAGADGVDGVDANINPVYANFGCLFDDALNVTIASSSGDGTTVPIYRDFMSNGISVDTTNNYWTHSETGVYALHFTYRQSAGGDIWTLYGVAKDGTNSMVGMSSRTGSEDNHLETVHITYKVTSTTSNYRLQGWCHTSSRTAGLASGSPTGNPTWTADTDGGIISSGTWVGRTYDIFLYKVSNTQE